MKIDLTPERLARALHAYGDISEDALSAMIFAQIADKVRAVEENEQLAQAVTKVAPF